MATKTEVKNKAVNNLLENQEMNAVCKNLNFSDSSATLHATRKRCVSTSIIISSSPKKKKKESKKFLLGGNISDPLNLNSLQDEHINKAMNKTPKSSPLHSNTINIKKDQVNVIFPRNLSDPLELNSMSHEAKAVACSDLFNQKTLQKCQRRNFMSNLIFDSSLLENSSENDNIPNCDKKEKEEDISSTSNEEFDNKVVSSVSCICVPENNTPCAIVDVIEEIKKILENEFLVQPIVKSNIPITRTSVEVVVKNEPNKPLTPEKTIEEGKKTQDQFKKMKSTRGVVSPVVSQLPLPEKQCTPPKQAIVTSHVSKKKENKREPVFNEKKSLFKYGNYNRYYGYRNHDDVDYRLKVLAERIDLFYNKDVLDIGCNIGHVTFSVARNFGAKSVVGMDIDHKLINIARKNIQYYINDSVQSSPYLSSNDQFNESDSKICNNIHCDKTNSFPTSLPLLYGPINLSGMTVSERFPFNVSFIQGNYVLKSDTVLSMETCKFDVILCLSITKWLHLNWGDDGLKRAFKRMYAQLRPGGILVVEPQPWKSYSRRKTLTETIWRNYKNIQLKPAMFSDYLLKEVGFANCETLPMPHNRSKGFQRPLKLYRKSNSLVTKNLPVYTIGEPNEAQKS